LVQSGGTGIFRLGARRVSVGDEGNLRSLRVARCELLHTKSISRISSKILFEGHRRQRRKHAGNEKTPRDGGALDEKSDGEQQASGHGRQT